MKGVLDGAGRLGGTQLRRGMLAGADLFPVGRTPAKPSRPEVTFLCGLFSGQGGVHRRRVVNSDEGSAGRRRESFVVLSSGEGTLAGADLFRGGRTPAKPSLPEVTF